MTSSGPAGHSPSCPPRCCVCSWLSGRPAGSLGHLRIPGTPAHRSRRPRCIPPISSHLLEVLCGGSHSRRSWMSPRHRSGLRRRPPLPTRWHGQRQTLAWLGINRAHGVISQGNALVFLPNILHHHLNIIEKQKVISVFNKHFLNRVLRASPFEAGGQERNVTPALCFTSAAFPPNTAGAGFDPTRVPMAAQNISKSLRGHRRELLE